MVPSELKFNQNRFIRTGFLLAILALACGCATTGEPDPADPWEGFNRGVYQFNEATDTVLFDPLGQVYRAVTPQIVDDGVSNFFSNLGDIAVAANDFLQLNFHQGMTTVTRFVLNSTLGIGGIFDFSGIYAGSPKTENDFGLTLAHYGVESGPYLVLPLFGPSSVRDTGRFVDGFMNPLFYLGNNDAIKYSLMSLNVVDTKSDLAVTQGLLSEAALDEYDFVKSAYLERRRAQVEGVSNPDMQDVDMY